MYCKYSVIIGCVCVLFICLFGRMHISLQSHSLANINMNGFNILVNQNCAWMKESNAKTIVTGVLTRVWFYLCIYMYFLEFTSIWDELNKSCEASITQGLIDDVHLFLRIKHWQRLQCIFDTTCCALGC